MTASKNARLGFPTTSAWTPAAFSSAATKGPGPSESVALGEDEEEDEVVEAESEKAVVMQCLAAVCAYVLPPPSLTYTISLL